MNFLPVWQQCSDLEKENQTRKERIEAKQQQLRELILQQVSFKSLVSRNKEQEERGLVPSPSSAIQMPFIIVNTHKKTNINCSISNDKLVLLFTIFCKNLYFPNNLPQKQSGDNNCAKILAQTFYVTSLFIIICFPP